MQQGAADLPLRHRHTVSGGSGSNSSSSSSNSNNNNKNNKNNKNSNNANNTNNTSAVRSVRSQAALSGAELEDLHVPQVAEKRYSWEDEIDSQTRPTKGRGAGR